MATADYSSMNRVQVERLNEGNYSTWKMDMRYILEDAGIYSYALGKEEIPEVATHPKEFAEYTAKDLKAKAKICFGLTTQFRTVVENETTANGVWNKLQTVFEPKSRARIAQTRRKFLNAKLEEGEPVNWSNLHYVITCHLLANCSIAEALRLCLVS